MFLVYQGWTGTVGGKTYNTCRIWGEMNPNPGIEETNGGGRTVGPGHPKPTTKCMPTIVRGVLLLEEGAGTSSSPSWLLDAAGRKVAVLHAGANDVSRLSPGVYFVREEAQASSHKPQAVRKVVVQR